VPRFSTSGPGASRSHPLAGSWHIVSVMGIQLRSLARMLSTDAVHHDHQGAAAIKIEYVSLAGMMLSQEAHDAGFRPGFATHDDSIIRRVADLAQGAGCEKHEFEFEFLFGVRPDWQRQLRAEGHSVRV
jgi:hypothetical protein